MVEAVGFEPTSENLQPKATTCLSPLLVLASSSASGRALKSASPLFLAPLPRTMQRGQPESLTSLRPVRRRPGDALLYYLSSECQFSIGSCCLPCVLRAPWHLGMQPPTSWSPSKPVAPFLQPISRPWIRVGSGCVDHYHLLRWRCRLFAYLIIHYSILVFNSL